MRIAHSRFRLWPWYAVAKTWHHLSSVLFDARWLRNLKRIDTYIYMYLCGPGEIKRKIATIQKAISLVETEEGMESYSYAAIGNYINWFIIAPSFRHAMWKAKMNEMQSRLNTWKYKQYLYHDISIICTYHNL